MAPAFHRVAAVGLPRAFGVRTARRALPARWTRARRRPSVPWPVN